MAVLVHTQSQIFTGNIINSLQQMKRFIHWSKIYVTTFLLLGILTCMFIHTSYDSAEWIYVLLFFTGCGFLLSILYTITELVILPWRKNKIYTYFKKEFIIGPEDSFIYKEPNFTHFIKFKQNLRPIFSRYSSPYSEWIEVLTKIPANLNKNQVDKLKFHNENVQIENETYLRAYYNGQFKAEKLINFINKISENYNNKVKEYSNQIAAPK
jgi:hypothetical protein